jgi:energy-converting hydrogenase Eha subunit C
MPTQVTLPVDESEAWSFLVGGVVFFLRTHTMKTLLVLALVAGGVVYVVFDYLTTNKVKVAPADPIGETRGLEISLVPRAFALEQQRGDPIKINGRLYGFSDPSYRIYKLIDQDAILVQDLQGGTVVRMEIPAIRRDQMKQFKR